MPLSPRIEASMRDGAGSPQLQGRHYRGARLHGGRPTPWVCPSCGLEQAGRFEDGCRNDRCGAGRPVPKAPTPAPVMATPAASRPGVPSIADQLHARHGNAHGTRVGVTDLAAFEARLIARFLDALDARDTAVTQFTLPERVALVQGLTTLIQLIELGDIDPPADLLPLPQLTALAQRLDADSLYESAPVDTAPALLTTPNPERMPDAASLAAPLQPEDPAVGFEPEPEPAGPEPWDADPDPRD